jgi:hypothetical protein
MIFCNTNILEEYYSTTPFEHGIHQRSEFIYEKNENMVGVSKTLFKTTHISSSNYENSSKQLCPLWSSLLGKINNYDTWFSLKNI